MEDLRSPFNGIDPYRVPGTPALVRLKPYGAREDPRRARILGINLTEDDKVDIQRIRTRLEADESLRDVFNQVLDKLLLAFVHTTLDLYKKLTEPKVNEMLKRQWFEVRASGTG